MECHPIVTHMLTFLLVVLSFLAIHFDLTLEFCGSNKWVLVVGHISLLCVFYFHQVESIQHFLVLLQFLSLSTITVTNGIIYASMTEICKTSMWGKWSLGWALLALVFLVIGVFCSFLYTAYVEIAKRVIDKTRVDDDDIKRPTVCV